MLLLKISELRSIPDSDAALRWDGTPRTEIELDERADMAFIDEGGQSSLPLPSERTWPSLANTPLCDEEEEAPWLTKIQAFELEVIDSTIPMTKAIYVATDIEQLQLAVLKVAIEGRYQKQANGMFARAGS